MRALVLALVLALAAATASERVANAEALLAEMETEDAADPSGDTVRPEIVASVTKRVAAAKVAVKPLEAAPDASVMIKTLTVPRGLFGATTFRTTLGGLQAIDSRIVSHDKQLELLSRQIATTNQQQRRLKLARSLMHALLSLRKAESFLHRVDAAVAHYKEVIKSLGEEASELGAHMKRAEEDFKSERESMNKKLDDIRTRLDAAGVRLTRLSARRAHVFDLVSKWKDFVSALRDVHDYASGRRPHRHAAGGAALPYPPEISATLAAAGMQPLPALAAAAPAGFFGGAGSPRFALRGADAAAAAAGGGADATDAASSSAQLSAMQQELDSQRAAIAAEMEGGAAGLAGAERDAAADAESEGAPADADVAAAAAAAATEQKGAQAAAVGSEAAKGEAKSDAESAAAAAAY